MEGSDERYFMFGEDIDFSLRIQHAGYDNYYLGNVSILHHKGKSTDKNSHLYIERFYGAMKIFYKTILPQQLSLFRPYHIPHYCFKKAILKLRLLNMKHSTKMAWIYFFNLANKIIPFIHGKSRVNNAQNGESVAEATIISWHKEVGDSIELDETVVEIATDKVDSEVPSSLEGVLIESSMRQTPLSKWVHLPL